MRYRSVLFMHVPKTGGQTMNQILERQYDPAEVFSITAPPQESIARFRNLSAQERGRLKLLAGHMPFGLHPLMPQPSRYFTLLREPIDRVLSYYYYALRSPHMHLHDLVAHEQMGLEEFVSSGITLQVDNDQTRFVSGAGYSVGFGECTVEMLEQAKANIREHFALAGTTDRFDETLLLLRRELGYRNTFYVRSNVAKDRPSRSSHSADELDYIRTHNQLDSRLYQWVHGEFEDRIGALGDGFAREVTAFRRLNAAYAGVAKAIRQISRTGRQVLGR